MSGFLPRHIAILICLIAGLGGCAGRTYYSDLPEPTAAPSRGAAASSAAYVVKAGDTLYSISFSLGTDWRELAALNGIAPPYRIYPGQSLRTANSGRMASVPPGSSPAAAPAVARPIPAPDPGGPLSSGPLIAATPPPASAPPPAETRPVVTAPAAPPAKSVAPPRPGAWQWPSAGRMFSGFSGGAQPHKGVDLEGKPGDPVLAANSGTVVYAGDGVRGYGNLLIVKHDATFLSAYAHNSRLLVKEGDVVTGGQKIAEIGDSGTDRYKLHFEIRKQGNPIDPLTILPRR